MTAEETAHVHFMSLFNNSPRRHRRNALSDIFECLVGDERVAFFHRLRLRSANNTTSCDENGELVFCNAMDHSTLSSPDTCCCVPSNNDHQDIIIPNNIQDNSEEKDRLSGLSEEESPISFSPNNMETARPSFLVGLKPTSSTNSSSSSFTSTSSMSSSQQTPSSSNSNSNSSPSSPSSEGEERTQSCSPENSTNTHGCSSSTPTTSPTSSPSSMICYNISFSRVRRNALHDLLETLTQDDIEKLKNLYQTTLYSLKPFSEQTQSPIQGFHECKA